MSKENTKKLLPLVAVGIFTGALIFSLIRFACLDNKTRRTFEFLSYDRDDKVIEIRYMPENPVNGQIQCYVEELLLGPMTNRCRDIFPRGTQIEFCELKGKKLYISLSDTGLKIFPDRTISKTDRTSKKNIVYSVKSETYFIKDNIRLFKYNIVKNFTNVDKIYLYIGGLEVDEEML